MDTIWQPSLEGRAGPKYAAVAEAIRDGVHAGALTAGQKLPPVRELAWTLGITPGTVARAYTELTDEGLLQAAVGRGTFVAERRKPAAEAMPDGPMRLYGPSLPDVGQVALIRELMVKVGQEGGVSDMLDYPSRVATPLRDAAIRWLASAHLGPLDAPDVVPAHGGQHAILLTMQAILSGPEPVILVEEMLYPGFRRAADLLRAKPVAVPMDEHGIIPGALEEAVRRHGAQLLCTSPEVHNPTTLCTPEWRRLEIVDVARRTGLQLVEDDCYRLGTPVGRPYRALLPGQGWYVTSLSKHLTPALRIGFAVAPPGRGAGLRRAAEHGFFGISAPLADLTVELLHSPKLNRLIDEARRTMNDYVRAAVNVLGGHDLTWREDVPFLYLGLPSGWRAGAFCQRAEAAGVQVRAADEFVLRDGRAPHAVRISVNARHGLARFEGAMQKLRELLDNPPEQISV
ncbi:PLP-dependent aminotransferase family protein [Psychromarinibacter sp. S121]|uniref:aminotransferase-like domain-containing protein n=1 Tax=Psychromarinibacter sp. S121 TaxID=3415127 RepID=UPI003C7A1BDC